MTPDLSPTDLRRITGERMRIMILALTLAIASCGGGAATDDTDTGPPKAIPVHPDCAASVGCS